MSAVLAWARLDLRRRWRSFAVLVLLVGFSGAVVLGTLAGARRTDTAFERLEPYTLPADVMVLPNQPNFDWSKVRTLPSVKTLGTFVLTMGPNPTFDHGLNPGDNETFAPGDAVLFNSIDRAKILRGRQADPMRNDEAIASPGFIARYGDVIAVRLPTRAQVEHDNAIEATSTAPNEGRTVRIHIVGEGLSTFGPNGLAPQIQPTYGYFRDYLAPVYDYFRNARVALKGGAAAIPEFRKELAAATGNPNIDVVDWRSFLKSAVHAARFTATGWLLFAAVAFVASVVLVGQALVRFCGAAVDDLRTLGALGLDRSQARLATVALPALAVLVGAAVAVGGAATASQWFPTGVAHAFEATPGVRVDLYVLGVGAAGLAVVALLGAWTAARGATHQVDESRQRRSAVAAAAVRLGLGPAAVLGTRFALEPGRGRSRVPVRPALVGAVAGVLGVVGALTFRTGLDAAADNPTRFGQTMPYGAFLAFNGAPTREQIAGVDAAAHDPSVAFMDDLRVAVFSVNGRQVSSFSLTPLVGKVPITTFAGRAPQGDDEISLAPGTAKALHVHVGDTVTVGDRAMRVSGVTFVPEDAHNGYDDGAWIATPGFSALQPETKDKYHEVRFALKPGTDTGAALARLTKDLGAVDPAPVPEELHLLGSVRWQPLLLGGFLILLALGAVGHALAVSVRRRRHDVAVLRALGMTRRQSRLIVAMQATVLAGVGLAFGIPLGIAAGRTAWRTLADATPLVYVAPLAAVAVLLTIPAAVVIANTLAALPARRASRLQVSGILRAE
jgi:ABC-type lipoprotein release transport system permease subunit